MMIFFDIDDTLLDNKAAECAAAREFHRSHTDIFPVSAEEFAYHWRMITEKHVHRYQSGELSFQGQRRERLRELFALHRTLTDPEADALFAGYLESYEKNWTLFPDVASCLEQLSGVEIGIISNGDSFQQRQKLSATGIVGHFSIIVISGELGLSKPDPRIFLEACRMAKAHPTECWHIGDNIEADVQGSLSAGLHGIWLNRNDMNQHEEAVTIGSLSELNRLINASSTRIQTP